MARTPKTETPDLERPHDLTAGLIERLACPDGKAQAFLRDLKAPGLRVRVTENGAKSFVFESKLNRKTIRRTIGDVRTWSIEAARKEANRLRVEIDKGTDPRETERVTLAAKAAAEAQAEAQTLTVGDAWAIYLVKGKPKRRDKWKPRYLSDLKTMSSAGGQPKKRGQGLTRPGPLHPLMALPLVKVTEDALIAWHDIETTAGKHQAARALMMFRGFLRWCATQPQYRGLVAADVAKAPALLESLPSMTRRTDALEAAQVEGWWAGVEQLDNRVASVYLRALVLTGARREEMAALRWKDIDFRWKKLTIADKVEATRTIPLTPYLAHMLHGRKR